jgi:hypothetical protein
MQKNYWNTKSINQNKKILKKTVFRTLKVERGQKYARTEFAGPTQNPKKIIRTSNQPIRTKFFPKKSMFSTLKVLRSQNLVWGLPDGICGLDPKS